MRELPRTLFGVLQPQLHVGDVVAQRRDACARDVLADEIADQ
jgi:hypothetical protein